jgi:glycine cleavage system regulatory protein
MRIPLVMTVMAPDRTGLVEELARAVADHGGNWLESRMCRLGGEFAGILRIELPPENKQPLLDALQKISGLNVLARAVENTTPSKSSREMHLEIVGHDRPGIVREATSALARAGVNVEEFYSECVSAPMSGEPLFRANARLAVPGACDLVALKQQLEKIAADLLVDISFVDGKK